ncbi:MAG: hypothetical protein ACRDLK_05820 [Gaiellaceae bacterium]
MTLASGSSDRDPSRQDLAETLRNPQLYAKLALLQDEMLEQLAPAADGPVVVTGRRHRGRLVFGDAID